MSQIEQVLKELQSARLFRLFGRVVKVVGLTIESIGPHANIGDICAIDSGTEKPCLAEVVGFRDERLVLMPLGELSSIAPGADVLALQTRLTVPCGMGLLGRVLGGLGKPIDGKGPILDTVEWPVETSPPDPLVRPPISEQIRTGVRVIDGLMSVGRGQRIGIFAGSGVGKSTLLSMIARNTSADMNVIALIGERGREVREFMERDLGEEGLKNSVMIVATSDQPPLIRLKASMVATAVAEYFRDEGYHVNFMMDSVTRMAMAGREIGLAVGEPPTSRGYTPSVFSLLPKVLERTGTGKVGSITAFYTVLVDGDDMNDPIADAVRGILDGHIVLSRELANAGQFPAIDVLASLSRLFPSLASPEHYAAAVQVRQFIQKYRQVEDLLRIGAYQAGSDPEADLAIKRMPQVRAFLKQSTSEEHTELSSTMKLLYLLAGVSDE
jgi:flagellum-specific ATP synthase